MAQETRVEALERENRSLRTETQNLRKVIDTLGEKYAVAQNILNNTSDSVIETDLEGVVTFVNSSGLEVTGLAPSEVLGKIKARDLWASGWEGTRFEEALAGHGSRGMATLQTRAGVERKLMVSVGPLVDVLGAPRGGFFVGTDISDVVRLTEELKRNNQELKRLQEELQRHADQLETEARQRSDELMQSEKMASIGQLVAGVAHEINNPLAYILSNTDFFRQDLLELRKKCEAGGVELQILDDMLHQLDSNLDGIRHIASITKTLKRFARPDVGGKVPSDVNQGLRDTLVMVHNQLKHRITVHEEYGQLPDVTCNIGQLNQVFMNLIINASQAMEKGDIWIRTSNGNGDVLVEIRDNGSGIPEESLRKIFDPFFTTKKEGNGLGLSLSYRIIQDHKGEIKVDSQVGKGTVFQIRVPVGG